MNSNNPDTWCVPAQHPDTTSTPFFAEPMTMNTTLDTNVPDKDTFESGAQRDTSSGKPRPDLIDTTFLSATAEEMNELLMTAFDMHLAKDQVYNAVTNYADYPTARNLQCLAESCVWLFVAEYPNYTQERQDELEVFDLNYIGVSALAPAGILRIGQWLQYGADKYGENNWRIGSREKRGISVLRYYESWSRHYWKWLANETESGDDHFAALFFNAMGMYCTHADVLKETRHPNDANMHKLKE